jgi:hypothetical protein
MTKKRKKKDNSDTETSIFQEPPKPSFTVVKTSLKSIIKDYQHNFPILNNLVLKCNEIVTRTYQIIRLYTLYKFGRQEQLPKLDKDTILYFIRACGTRAKQGRQAKNKAFECELDAFYQNEFGPLINKSKFDLKNKSYLTPYLAQQIQTAFNNNLKEHFITRIRRFMNILKPEDDLDKSGFNRIKNLILLDKLDQIPEVYQEWSRTIRDDYLPETCEKCFGYDVKVNPEKYLYYFLKMNKEIERRNNLVKGDNNLTGEEKRIRIKRLFQPVPLRNSVIPSYITIDTNVILSLFKKEGESGMNKKTKRYKNYIWDKIFRTGKKVMQRKGYEYKTVLTDGIGVSICFQRVGRRYGERDLVEIDGDGGPYIDQLSTSDLETCKSKRLVSIDPGKSNMVFMANERGDKLRYTASQRRRESLRKRCNAIILRNKRKEGVIEKETGLSSYNSKTVDYLSFKEYLKEKTQLNDQVKGFYEAKLYRKLKWRTSVYKRKSEDNFLNQVEEKYGDRDSLLLCYGNWSNNRQMRGVMPTMGVGLRRVIGKRFQVVLVDEFRSSKLCSRCEGELKNYKRLHRVLVCNGCKSSGSESEKSIFMNRDMNACMNLLRISNSWINERKRPEVFCRTPNPDLSSEGVKRD